MDLERAGWVTVLEGGREALEREWLRAMVLEPEGARLVSLMRMLRPAANDAFEARVLMGWGEPFQASESNSYLTDNCKTLPSESYHK